MKFYRLAPHPRDQRLFVLLDQDDKVHPIFWWGATRDELAVALLSEGFVLHADGRVTSGRQSAPG